MPLRAQRTTPRHGLRSSFVSDRRLVQRITQGDDAAFSELLARYRSTLYATAYAVLLDPEQVAVVVADAFEEARRTVAEFLDTQGSVSGWLTHLTRLRIARHHAARPLRGHGGGLTPPASPGAGRARHWIFALYLASAVFVTVQQGVVGRSNNFKVFRAAAVNLLAHRDLYAAHPDQHFDFYKYSPSFALLFAPFAALPFAAALLIWSLLNSLLLWYAVRRLLPDRQATLALALVYLEVLFAMQYTQSNGLVTALILLAFLALEQGRELRAALLIGLDTFVKIFPLGAAVLALLYPRRWRFALLLAAVGAGLALLPLVVIPPHELVAQYRSWWTIEMADASRVNRGDSVMQFLYRWVGADWPNWPVQLGGTLLLLAPLALQRGHWADRAFRLRFLCSLLVYLVLFNHQSERASFVIAYAGLAIWYAASEPDPVRNAIALVAVVALVLQGVEIVPWGVHDALGRYRVKAIPCLAAWIVMQTELLGWRRWSPRLHGPEVREADIPPPEPLAQR